MMVSEHWTIAMSPLHTMGDALSSVKFMRLSRFLRRTNMIANETHARNNYGALEYIQGDEDYSEQPIDIRGSNDWLIIGQLDPTNEMRHVILIPREDLEEFLAKCREVMA